MPGAALITRPRAQGEASAARLRALGHTVHLDPLSEAVFADPPAADAFAGVQAVLVTSANGVAGLAYSTDARTLPLLAVGDRTAEAARAAGFVDVRSAAGDASDLAALALARLDPGAGPVLHARGARRGHSPLPPLIEAGFETREAVLYRVDYRDRFRPDTEQRLRNGEIGAVLAYSPKSACAIIAACRAVPGFDGSALAVAAISPAALAPFEEDGGFGNCVAASAPNEDALFAVLESG